MDRSRITLAAGRATGAAEKAFVKPTREAEGRAGRGSARDAAGDTGCRGSRP